MIDAAQHYRPDPAYLRELLAKAGISQREAARRLGVSDVTMRRWLMTPPRAVVPYSAQVALEVLASVTVATPPRRVTSAESLQATLPAQHMAPRRLADSSCCVAQDQTRPKAGEAD